MVLWNFGIYEWKLSILIDIFFFENRISKLILCVKFYVSFFSNVLICDAISDEFICTAIPFWENCKKNYFIKIYTEKFTKRVKIRSAFQSRRFFTEMSHAHFPRRKTNNTIRQAHFSYDSINTNFKLIFFQKYHLLSIRRLWKFQSRRINQKPKKNRITKDKLHSHVRPIKTSSVSILTIGLKINWFKSPICVRVIEAYRNN